jgi:Flp pilus assembly protein TadD
MVLMAQGRVREAESEFRQAVRINPEYPEGHAELGRLFHKLNRKADARKHYDEALRLDPYNAFHHINLATLMRDEGDFSGADREYKAALACPMLDEETRHHLHELLGGA